MSLAHKCVIGIMNKRHPKPTSGWQEKNVRKVTIPSNKTYGISTIKSTNHDHFRRFRSWRLIRHMNTKKAAKPIGQEAYHGV